MVQLQNKRLMMDKELAAEHHNQQTGKLMQRSEKSIKYEMMEKLNDVKQMIDQHMNEMHSTISNNARQTVNFLTKLQKKTANKSKPTEKSKPLNLYESDEKPTEKPNPTLLALVEIWKQIYPPQRSRKRHDTSVSLESGEHSNESDSSKISDKDSISIETIKVLKKEQV